MRNDPSPSAVVDGQESLRRQSWKDLDLLARDFQSRATATANRDETSQTRRPCPHERATTRFPRPPLA